MKTGKFLQTLHTELAKQCQSCRSLRNVPLGGRHIPFLS